ncbi:hypothetical protein ABIC47_000514 [Leifsonia sp. 563]|uniref:hypothetical protein n=1 Tax=Leifsonia sp. 563 TaxID=3156412 RepID=UPI00339429A8
MADVYTKGPVPAGLENAEFVLRPIAAADAEKDHAAVMESRAYLRLWEQSAWPEDDFTVDADRDDLAGLAARHADGRAFTFTVLSADGEQCLGCVYIFPPGATFLARAAVTALGTDRWEDLDIVAYLATRSAEALAVTAVQVDAESARNTVLDSGTDDQVVLDRAVNAFRATPTIGG